MCRWNIEDQSLALRLVDHKSPIISDGYFSLSAPIKARLTLFGEANEEIGESLSESEDLIIDSIMLAGGRPVINRQCIVSGVVVGSC